MKIRVYYEDTDLGGVVYHTNYIKYCESARSEVFFQNNMLPHTKDSFFVAKKLEADYKAPAKFGDTLEVSTSIVKLKNTSVVLAQSIKNQNNINLFDLEILMVFVKNGKPTKIPQSFRTMFDNF
jgi:acyl-CoA thioester hydrolase